jgi:hypothetical protein
MKKIMILLMGMLFILLSCSAKQTLNPKDPYSQASVKISLKDGTIREGIVLKKKGNVLIYVDAETHQKTELDFSHISHIDESNTIYDFGGYPLPEKEIGLQQSYKKTVLYGVGGLALGAAAGFGAFLAVIASDSTNLTAANAALFGITALGAAYFGYVGYGGDYEDAVLKARKKRFRKEKVKMEANKKELEKLKKQKSEKR